MKPQLRKIQRTADLPRFASLETSYRVRYPRTLSLPEHDVELRYRLSKPCPVGFDEDDYVRKRHLFCWIMHRGRRVGAIELNEYDPNGCAGNDHFMEIMDCDEEYEARLSGILCSVWTDLVIDVTHCGPILDFRGAWVIPALSNGALFADAAHGLIDTEFPDHSILVMKAFPLEYESVSTKGTSLAGSLRRRERAMVRHYRRVFGVEPLPGRHGKQGWLWRPNPAYVDMVDRPSASSRR